MAAAEVGEGRQVAFVDMIAQSFFIFSQTTELAGSGRRRRRLERAPIIASHWHAPSRQYRSRNFTANI